MAPIVPIILLLLTVPIFFFSKWILKKFGFGNPKNRKLIAILFSLLISPLIYTIIIVSWLFLISYYPSKDFDKQEWLSNVEERYKLSENIIESEMLIGKTEQEVIQLLGDQYSSHKENHISYYLGFVPKLANIDPDYLCIFFENGKVIKVIQQES